MNKQFKYGLLGAAALIATATAFAGFFTVGENQRGVVANWGKYTYVAEPGLHFKIPFRETVTYYPTGFESLSSGPDWINTYTIDSQEVDVTYTIFYRLPVDKIPYIFASNRDYDIRLQRMALDRMKAAMGQINTQQVAEKRGELRDKIKAMLAKDAEPMGIEVTDFQLTNLKYTDKFRDAINAAAVSKAGIEAREYERQQAEKTALREQVEALGKANAMREQAKGQADAEVSKAEATAKATILLGDSNAKRIRVEGEATAAAMQAQQKALQENAMLVDMERAKRWDGKLPQNIYGSAPLPFLQMGK